MFSKVRTLEELKKVYHAEALKNHPDKGGSVKKMQEINLAYEKAHDLLSKGSDDYGMGKAFIDIIDGIISLDGIMVEIVGSWIWVTGNTYINKDALKDAGFRWANKKKAWHWHPPEVINLGRGRLSLEAIRTKYGSKVVADNTHAALSI